MSVVYNSCRFPATCTESSRAIKSSPIEQTEFRRGISPQICGRRFGGCSSHLTDHGTSHFPGLGSFKFCSGQGRCRRNGTEPRHVAGADIFRNTGVEIKYLCETDTNRLNAAKKSFEGLVDYGVQTTGDFRQILDDPDVDILICAAPNHWHAPAAIMACNAGKHCYVEKPCSHNPWEGEMAVAAARKHKRCVQMGNQRRSAEKIIEAMKLLHEGRIGRVYYSRSWYANSRGSIGTGTPAEVPPHIDYELWQGPAPRQPFTSNRLPYNWHWVWHYGNGELGNTESTRWTCRAGDCRLTIQRESFHPEAAIDLTTISRQQIHMLCLFNLKASDRLSGKDSAAADWDWTATDSVSRFTEKMAASNWMDGATRCTIPRARRSNAWRERGPMRITSLILLMLSGQMTRPC